MEIRVKQLKNGNRTNEGGAGPLRKRREC